MKFRAINDRAAIEAFLLQNSPWHPYALADLDDFFWPATRWHAALLGDKIVAVCFVITKVSPPVFYAIAPPGDEATLELAAAVQSILPDRVFAHLGLGVPETLARDFRFESTGEYFKMRLTQLPSLAESNGPPVERLTRADLDELVHFYRSLAYTPSEAKKGRFFDPYMLDLGPYVGVRGKRGELVCAGGVHVVSGRYQAAGLGNIATCPEMRRRGLAASVTKALCLELTRTAQLIGLNVRTNNAPAISCYERLGFTRVGRYLEGTLVRRDEARRCQASLANPWFSPPGQSCHL